MPFEYSRTNVPMQSPKVKVAAYVVPHPLENKLHLRIETVHGETPSSALKTSLNRLIGNCDEMSALLDSKLTEFRQQQQEESA